MWNILYLLYHAAIEKNNKLILYNMTWIDARCQLRALVWNRVVIHKLGALEQVTSPSVTLPTWQSGTVYSACPQRSVQIKWDLHASS